MPAGAAGHDCHARCHRILRSRCTPPSGIGSTTRRRSSKSIRNSTAAMTATISALLP
jgi:hypothetical protein